MTIRDIWRGLGVLMLFGLLGMGIGAFEGWQARQQVTANQVQRAPEKVVKGCWFRQTPEEANSGNLNGIGTGLATWDDSQSWPECPETPKQYEERRKVEQSWPKDNEGVVSQ